MGIGGGTKVGVDGLVPAANQAPRSLDSPPVIAVRSATDVTGAKPSPAPTGHVAPLSTHVFWDIARCRNWLDRLPEYRLGGSFPGRLRTDHLSYPVHKSEPYL